MLTLKLLFSHMDNIEKDDINKITESDKSLSYKQATPKTMKYIFGVFMVCIYLGKGYIMMVNFFQWDENFTWARYSLGALFILYGFWRGYRQFKGKY